MTDNLQWYRVAGSRLVLRIDNDGEIRDAMQLRTDKVQVGEIELLTTTDAQRLEGNVFHVGARGLAYIATAIYAGLKNPTGMLIHSKLSDLFSGDPLFADVLAGLCRAVAGYDAESEAAYFLGCVEKQLAERPWVPVMAHVSWVDTGLPLGLSRSA